MKRRSVFLFFLLMAACASLYAQVASFTAPDTVCVNTPVVITNTSVGATTNFWNFCTANVNAVPQISTLGNVGNTFKLPVYIDYVLENGNYYGFVVNNSPGGLVRLDFGNNLLNTPTATDLGNFGGIISISSQGIQVIKNNGGWYAIIVGGDPSGSSTPSRILKIDFGANITNSTPLATNWGNIGGMDYPDKLFMFQDAAANWYGYTLSFRNNTVTRFSFGTNFNNPPTGTNLGNPGGVISSPTGMYPVNDNGTWRVFIANFSGSLARIDFGNSLLNTPTASTKLTIPGGLLNNPRDLCIFNYCSQYVAYVGNNDGSLTRLDFSTLISAPTGAIVGNVGSGANIHSISKVFRVGNDQFAFAPSSSSVNTMALLKFPGCTNSPISGSSLSSPPAITYTTAGIYTITLSTDEGLPTQTTACKQIVVTSPDPVAVVKDTAICTGDSAQLYIAPAKSYLWTPATGLSATTSANPKSSPAITTNYSVTINDKNTCTQQFAVKVTISAPPVITVTKSGDIDCSNIPIQLTASGGTQYLWSPSTGLSNANIANPTALVAQNTTYNVTATSSAGCKASGTVTVVVTGAASSTNPFLMPNAFTPNKDGRNDCFGITHWGTISQLEFSIFNRWGQLIFFTKDASKCWDGNIQGIPQPSGAYVYMIKATASCTEIERHGTFVLIR